MKVNKNKDLPLVLDGTINASGTEFRATGGCGIARVQPKGEKHVTTEAVYSKSNSPDSATAAYQLRTSATGTHPVKQKRSWCRIPMPSLTLSGSKPVSSYE